MAKTRGVVRLKGQIGDLTFFTQKGKGYVKQSSELNKDRILNDPAFRRTRENMAEFGGCAMVAKALRSGLSEVVKSMNSRYLNSESLKLMKLLNNKGPGSRGKRGFEILPNGYDMEGFEFKADYQLSALFVAPYTVNVNGDRNEVDVEIPVFNTDNFISSPPGATHFRIISTISVLSDYEYNAASKKYRPVEPALNEKNNIVRSAYLPLGGMTGAAIQLANALPGAPVMPQSVGLLFCLGIEFSQETNGNYYLLASKNALRLDRVF